MPGLYRKTLYEMHTKGCRAIEVFGSINHIHYYILLQYY